MDTPRLPFVCLLVGLVLYASTGSANSFEQCGLDDVRYEIIELGEAVEGSTATALSDRGEVGGAAIVDNERTVAFHWDCMHGLQMIDPSPDRLLTLPHDINNRGQMVGEWYEPDATFAFIWDRTNGMRKISEDQMIAYEFNDWGDVALVAGPPSVWNESSGVRAFDEVTGVQWWGFPRINNLRSVGGIRITAEGEEGPRFTVWNRAVGVRDLGIVSDDHVTVERMNDRGDLVGTMYRESSGLAYLLTNDGKLELLTSPGSGQVWSQISSFNNRRQVLGGVSDDTSSITFIWDPLNGLRDFQLVAAALSDQPGKRYGASSINNWGWIAGSLTEADGTRSRAVLFVPVPRNSAYFSGLSELSGSRLCRALDAVKLNAVLSCLARTRR